MFRPAPRGTDHSLKEYFYVLVEVELQKYTTDPYVSLASGNLCRTISTRFRDAPDNRALRAVRRRQPVAPRDCAADHPEHANT